jgi:carbamoyltransferase
MTNHRFDALFGGPPRDPEGPITKRECDLAASVQEVVTEVVMRIARHARDATGEDRAVLAGGVALNSVANGRLLRDGPFDEIWVQPAAGDAGSAVGCALWAWHEVLERPRRVAFPDGMNGSYLGPAFNADEVAAELEAADRPFTRLSDEDERAARIAELIDDGSVVGVFGGAMEFGPRALGHRSILADPRSAEMQSILNLKIKRRESFRPFAPAVLAEHASEWFDLDVESPYMLLVVPLRANRLVETAARTAPAGDVIDRVKQVRSVIPAVTHVDNSARVQTVDRQRAPRLHAILAAFHARTGCPVLINTSFNVRGEPIVCTPEEAYRCFMTTGIDWLVVEDCLLDRREQPPWSGEAVISLPD